MAGCFGRGLPRGRHCGLVLDGASGNGGGCGALRRYGAHAHSSRENGTKAWLYPDHMKCSHGSLSMSVHNLSKASTNLGDVEAVGDF
ncbi:hypothetical protein DAD186_00650 [Dermabacter vaginalis]|uniref:Uncharacterized protein n=1 Tax=Dermabacter vaginalis TaxID=1630135 RepID=A0A1B0ZF98_9MICO|nr:hypothetical protein DAD186_00650 [Dermabacter vaginalis]